MTLTDAHVGSKVKIVAVRAGHGLFGRLAAIGIVDGALVTVVKNSGQGPVVVDIQGSRFALGRGMAEKIEVRS